MLIWKRLSILFEEIEKKDALRRTLSGYKRIIKEKNAKKIRSCRILNNNTEIAQLLITCEVKNLWPDMLLVSKIGLVIILEKEK